MKIISYYQWLITNAVKTTPIELKLAMFLEGVEDKCNRLEITVNELSKQIKDKNSI